MDRSRQPILSLLFWQATSALSGVSVAPTVRNKTETVALSREVDFDHTVLGRDFDLPRMRKLGIGVRTTELACRMPDCDVSLSARNAICVLASAVRGVPSIPFYRRRYHCVHRRSSRKTAVQPNRGEYDIYCCARCLPNRGTDSGEFTWIGFTLTTGIKKTPPLLT